LKKQKPERDEYSIIVAKAISEDYENSPYHFFEEYWDDHEKGWKDRLFPGFIDDVFSVLSEDYGLDY